MGVGGRFSYTLSYWLPFSETRQSPAITFDTLCYILQSILAWKGKTLVCF